MQRRRGAGAVQENVRQVMELLWEQSREVPLIACYHKVCRTPPPPPPPAAPLPGRSFCRRTRPPSSTCCSCKRAKHVAHPPL